MFSFLGIDNVAMLGLPLRVISTMVLIFIFLGQLLLRSGGSAFFSDLASALMGRSRGGAAKIGVFASGLFGIHLGQCGGQRRFHRGDHDSTHAPEWL